MRIRLGLPGNSIGKSGGDLLLIHLIVPAFKRRGRSILPPLQLATIAAMTPAGHQVEIYDENAAALDFHQIPQLVGLTGLTSTAQRAYQLAKTFQQLGSTVVMGGPHATASPQEAKNYVDAVVMGEAQDLWPRVVEDVQENRLKPFYFHQTPPSWEGLPPPRRDLYPLRGYRYRSTLQTSQGCLKRCFYCPTPPFRHRPIEEVVEEVKGLGRGLFFVDDNLAASLQRARQLFTALIPLRRQWLGQASLAIAQKDILELAVESGCQGLFIGFHPFDATHGECLQRIHSFGIPVVGDFTLGFDGEGEEVIRQVVDFAEEEGLAAVRISLLTPFPGTPYYRELIRDRRIRQYHTSAYTGQERVFAPFFGSEMEKALKKTHRELYSLSSIIRRYFRGPGRLSFFFSQNWDLR